MKLTKWELEFLISQVEKETRRRISQKQSTKTIDKLHDKLSSYLNKKS